MIAAIGAMLAPAAATASLKMAKTPRRGEVPPTIIGFVIDTSNAPVPGAMVIIRERGGDEVARISTQPDGYFQLERPLSLSLLGSELLFIAQAANVGAGQELLVLGGGLNTVRIQVTGAQEQRVVREGWLRGRIVELGSGQPASDVRVSLEVRGSEIRSTRSNAEGLFSIDFDRERFSTDEAQVMMTSERYGRAVQDVDLRQAGSQLEFVVPPRHGTRMESFYPAILFQEDGWLREAIEREEVLTVVFPDQHFSRIQLDVGQGSRAARNGREGWMTELSTREIGDAPVLNVRLVQRLAGDQTGLRAELVEALMRAITATPTTAITCLVPAACPLKDAAIAAVRFDDDGLYPVATFPFDPNAWDEIGLLETKGSLAIPAELRAALEQTLQIKLSPHTEVSCQRNAATCVVTEPAAKGPLLYIQRTTAPRTGQILVPARLSFVEDERFASSVVELARAARVRRVAGAPQEVSQLVASTVDEWEVQAVVRAQPRPVPRVRSGIGPLVAWAPSIDSAGATLIGLSYTVYPFNPEVEGGSQRNPSQPFAMIGFSAFAGPRVVGTGGEGAKVGFAVGLGLSMRFRDLQGVRLDLGGYYDFVAQQVSVCPGVGLEIFRF